MQRLQIKFIVRKNFSKTRDIRLRREKGKINHSRKELLVLPIQSFLRPEWEMLAERKVSEAVYEKLRVDESSPQKVYK